VHPDPSRIRRAPAEGDPLYCLGEQAGGSAEREGTLGPDAYTEASENYGITWLG
jgi:hypothetical protein